MNNKIGILESELERVFTRKATCLQHDQKTATIAVEEWPEPIRYNIERALRALRMFRDGAGYDGEGDAAVCAVLEHAGAFLD